jgi:uncharacterized membrane protein
MTEIAKKNRIIFIDIMRAIAVFQMVQGHTIDAFLSNDYRTLNSPVFATWFFLRGVTAPIFLFSAGAVFTYLFRLNNKPFDSNPRVTKGLKRFVLLLFFGYLLRFPAPTLIDFSSVSAAAWQTFQSIDVLQLIGTGILFIITLFFLIEKFKLNDYWVFGALAMFTIFIAPLTELVNWTKYLPVYLASYFYKGTGSQFPIFPWIGFIFAGAFLGAFLAKNPMIFKSAKFSRNLFLVGSMFLLLALIGHIIGSAYIRYYYWDTSPNLMMLRLGFVLILNSVVSIICLRIESIPRIFILIGRNTLLIYVVHLVIIYGSAWNPGLSVLFDKAFNVWNTLGSAILMLGLMTLMVYIIHKLKMKNKEIVT